MVSSNKLRILADATLSQFAVLTSTMHMAWVRQIGGRLKSDYSYGIGMVYNTFPMPPANADVSKLKSLAKAVLDARAAYPDATLADLYDPDLMPPVLRRAHQTIDRVVDRLYHRNGFKSERESEGTVQYIEGPTVVGKCIGMLRVGKGSAGGPLSRATESPRSGAR